MGALVVAGVAGNQKPGQAGGEQAGRKFDRRGVAVVGSALGQRDAAGGVGSVVSGDNDDVRTVDEEVRRRGDDLDFGGVRVDADSAEGHGEGGGHILQITKMLPRDGVPGSAFGRFVRRGGFVRLAAFSFQDRIRLGLALAVHWAELVGPRVEIDGNAKELLMPRVVGFAQDLILGPRIVVPNLPPVHPIHQGHVQFDTCGAGL